MNNPDPLPNRSPLFPPLVSFHVSMPKMYVQVIQDRPPPAYFAVKGNQFQLIGLIGTTVEWWLSGESQTLTTKRFLRSEVKRRHDLWTSVGDENANNDRNVMNPFIVVISYVYVKYSKVYCSEKKFAKFQNRFLRKLIFPRRDGIIRFSAVPVNTRNTPIKHPMFSIDSTTRSKLWNRFHVDVACEKLLDVLNLEHAFIISRMVKNHAVAGKINICFPLRRR